MKGVLGARGKELSWVAALGIKASESLEKGEDPSTTVCVCVWGGGVRAWMGGF